jgi:hypothetical protein
MKLFKGLFKRVRQFIRLGIATHITDFLELITKDDSTSFNCKMRSRIFVRINSSNLWITRYITSLDILSMQRLNLANDEVILFLVLSKDATRYVVKDVFTGGDLNKFLKKCLPKSMLNQERFK